nr:hypothetical protein [Tanacetum cinerariifolium]
MGRDIVQLETAISTISQEYLLGFTSKYGISEDLHPELPGPGERIVDFPEGKVRVDVFQQETGENTPQCYTKPLDSLKNWNNRFFWVDERVFHTVADRRTSATNDEMPAENTYSPEAVMVLNTHRTPIQKQPEALICLVGLSRRYFLTEDQGQEAVAPEVPPLENVTTTVDTNAPPKVLRRDHADSRPTQSTIGGKSLASMRLGMGSTCLVPTSRDTPMDVSDPDPLSFADPQSLPTANVAQSSNGAAVAGNPKSENTSFTSMVGSPESIYRPEWGVTNDCLLDAPKACQDLVNHIAPPGYFSELRHLHNDDFLNQYNINLARQVEMGSQLRLRFEQEAKLLKKSVAKVARRDKRIQATENEIKNLETLLEAETNIKKTTEVKNAKLGKELENLQALFSYLQVSNDRLSQQVSTLQAQVTGQEKIKAAFEEFKQYEDNRVEKRCAEIDARLDAFSIDFDEELYPHIFTAIVGRRWVIRYGLRLAVMKCDESTELRQVFADVVSAGIAKGMSEGLKYGVEHGKANLSLEAIEAYDPEAEAKYIVALHALKDLKYPMVDRLKSLKDEPIDVLMASLHLKSDTRDDALQ